MKHRRLLLLALLIGVAVAPTSPARAETASAQPAAEAWYAPSPTCTTPLGCLPIPPLSNYPAGTMHVGVRAGLEEARTYLRLDLASVPSDATLTAGKLTIPLGGTDAGTVNAEMSTVVACFNISGFTAVEASTNPAPPVDCTTSSPATFNAGTPTSLTVDLAPFAARWAAGEANEGIGLVPSPTTAPGATWHVAFPSGTATASLEYDPTIAPEPAPTVEEPSFVDDGFFPSVPLGAPIALPPRPSSAPLVEQAAGPTQVRPVFTVSGPGFAYPAVFVLPLLLLGLGGYLAWALTRPVLPVAR